MKFSKYLRLLLEKGLSAATQREDLIKRCKVKYPGGHYNSPPTELLLKSKKYRLKSGVIVKVEYRRRNNGCWRPYNSINGFSFERFIKKGNKRYVISSNKPGEIISWDIKEPPDK